jgi:uncharacterized protein
LGVAVTVSNPASLAIPLDPGQYLLAIIADEHMTATPVVSIEDLEALEKYLISDDSPENGMGLSDLDGFLIAVIVGPELIIPSEWLPAVWGHEEAQFSDQRQAEPISDHTSSSKNTVSNSADVNTLSAFFVHDQRTVVTADHIAGSPERRPAWA